MKFFTSRAAIILSGLIVGFFGVLLVVLGNPANMGVCVACFYRDIAGSLGLHQAAVVQYMRPEILGFMLGAFLIAVVTGEFKSQGGSSTSIRFFLGMMVMFGALVFLGCPLRMLLRLGAGDLNALVALAGFTFGIVTGIFFLKNGFTLGRAYDQKVASGLIMPVVFALLTVLAFTTTLFIVSEKGPGSQSAPFMVSLGVGLLIGIIAQRTRICCVGGIRDSILIRDNHLTLGLIGILVTAIVMNIYYGKFKLGFIEQPIAHTEHLWNFLGLYVVGLASVFLGGCPLRQTILAGQGSMDAGVTVLGLIVGAAFAHNFGIAASPKGVPMAGKYVVMVSIALLFVVGILQSNFSSIFASKDQKTTLGS